MTHAIATGDCLDVLRDMEPESVDAIVTDPPAGIAFMGKAWDRDKGGREAWIAWMAEIARECYRVLPPGGHALVWALPRTSHWTATAWEDAGFEVRDRVSHLFGTGFPKSHNVGKAIDKMKGAEREDLGPSPNWREAKRTNGQSMGAVPNEARITAPATPEAEAWDGWGTALKPAMEDWWLLRKPLAGTVAANVLEHGTGALNIDATRVPTDDVGLSRTFEPGVYEGPGGYRTVRTKPTTTGGHASGRWPAHLVHDGSEEVTERFAAFGESKSKSGGVTTKALGRINDDAWVASDLPRTGHDDTGTAARFFYCAKASKAERNAATANGHPTVKPLALMRWLVRLITPPGGTVLDPFAGSGSTGCACAAEGFSFHGIEQSAEYADIARARVAHAYAEHAHTQGALALTT